MIESEKIVSMEDICEIIPPLYILLPTCTESKTDVFLNILKNSLARSKLDDHYLDNALKLGTSANKFSIELEDVSMNWSELNSKEQQIRQSKLLGFWAIYNFPSLGNKLFGKSWQPPNRRSLQVVGRSKELCPDEIDVIVFRKLKPRVMQLNVSLSTLAKLQHFVSVPANICKTNESQVSPKVKSFDIDGEFIENCWQALKLGKFSLDVNFEVMIKYY